ncbi:MAG: hypothetical protein ABEJ03_00375 [Candidatus Nanohaloarchaea archaeon]
MEGDTKRHLGELMIAAGATMVLMQVAVFNVYSLFVGSLLFFSGLEIYLKFRTHHEEAVDNSHLPSGES